MYRKWRFLIVSLVLVLALCAPAAYAAEKKIVMRIGTITAMPQVQSFSAETFKKLVEEKVGDRLDVQVYHTSQLGTMPQHLQGLQNGSVHAIFLPCGFQSLMVPEIGVLDLPFFFPNSEWVYKMFNRGYTAPLTEAMLKKGVIFVSTPPSPDRNIMTTKPIAKESDFAGTRIRTYASPINQQTIGAFGFTPVNIDTSEISVAIQQGTVDGIETDITFWNGMKLFKANYRMANYQGSIVHMMSVSKRWFDNLPKDIQDAIIEAGKAVPPIAHEHVDKVLLPRVMNDPDGKIIDVELPKDVLDGMIARSKKVHDFYVGQGPTFKATYDYYKALIEQYPNGDAPVIK